MEETNAPMQDLLMSYDELTEYTYDKQGVKIAYQRSPEEVTTVMPPKSWTV